MARITVRFKPTGQIGTIEDKEFDNSIYEAMDQENQGEIGQDNKNTNSDLILKILGKGAEFLAPATTKQFSTAMKNFDPNLSAEEKIKNIEQIKSDQWKSGLELLSYLIPFGKGANVITKTVAPALGVYGAQQLSQDKPMTPGGAITSVVTAGILGKLLGMGSKVKTAGEELRKGVLNPKAKLDPFYEKTRNELLKTAEEVGLKGSASDQLKQLPSIFENIKGKVKGLLGKTKISEKEVVKSFTDKLVETTDYKPVDKTWASIRRQLLQKIKKLGTSFSDEAVYNLKNQIGDSMSNIFKKVDRSVPLSPKEQATKAMFDSLKDVLEKKVPGIKNYNLLQHQLYELSPGLVESSKGKIILPVLGQFQGIPGVRESLQKSADLSGRALKGAGSLLENITKPLQRGENALNQVLQRTLGNKAEYVDPQQSSLQYPQDDQQKQQQTDVQSEDESVLSPGGQWRWDPKADDWVRNEKYDSTSQMQTVGGLKTLSDMIPLLMLQDLENTGGKNITELNTLLNALPKDDKKSAAILKRQIILEQASPVLARISESALKAPTGLVGSGLSFLGKIPGIEGGEAEYLSRDTDAFARLIASAFASEVGVATDRDVARWKGMMPQPGDTMNERRRQIKMMMDQITKEAETLNMEVPPSIQEVLDMLQKSK